MADSYWEIKLTFITLIKTTRRFLHVPQTNHWAIPLSLSLAPIPFSLSHQQIKERPISCVIFLAQTNCLPMAFPLSSFHSVDGIDNDSHSLSLSSHICTNMS